MPASPLLAFPWQRLDIEKVARSLAPPKSAAAAAAAGGSSSNNNNKNANKGTVGAAAASPLNLLCASEALLPSASGVNALHNANVVSMEGDAAVSVALGTHHGVIRTKSGKVYSWGANVATAGSSVDQVNAP
jgi:hypothetical protein